jgi:hypothetical protein
MTASLRKRFAAPYEIRGFRDPSLRLKNGSVQDDADNKNVPTRFGKKRYL